MTVLGPKSDHFKDNRRAVLGAGTPRQGEEAYWTVRLASDFGPAVPFRACVWAGISSSPFQIPSLNEQERRD